MRRTSSRPHALLAGCAALVGVVGLAACGDDSSSSSSSSTTKAAATTAAATTTAGATTTKAAATTAAPAPGGTDVTLKEWSVEAPTTLKAGNLTFNVKNAGTTMHELLAIKGDSFAALPKAANGSVDESALPAGALIKVVDRFAAGTTATGTANLPAGKYVLLCNLGAGPNSHAAKGQHLDVTVTG